jgi:hypothetical protein
MVVRWEHKVNVVNPCYTGTRSRIFVIFNTYNMFKKEIVCALVIYLSAKFSFQNSMQLR